MQPGRFCCAFSGEIYLELFVGAFLVLGVLSVLLPQLLLLGGPAPFRFYFSLEGADLKVRLPDLIACCRQILLQVLFLLLLGFQSVLLLLRILLSLLVSFVSINLPSIWQLNPSN
jgi:hypothetical protein